MSSTEDEQIEYLIHFIGALNEREDTRSPQDKFDAALNAKKEIYERLARGLRSIFRTGFVRFRIESFASKPVKSEEFCEPNVKHGNIMNEKIPNAKPANKPVATIDFI